MNTPGTASVVDVRGVSKRYANVQALVDVDFEVAPGEVRALLGKNGAGKSTLIRMLSGAELPDRGEVVLDGVPLGTAGVEGARRLGVRTVYQELSLVGSMTIAENMFMGRWLRSARGVDYRAMAEQTAAALRRLDIDLDPGTPVSELGIADQQMVEIARSLRDDLKVLILDEPTSSLAAGEVHRVLDTVNQIASEGVAVIYVSHRLDEIRRVAATASVMRDGRLVETAPVTELSTQDVVRMMLGTAAQEVSRVARPPRADLPVTVCVRGLAVEPKLQSVDLDLRAGEVLGLAGILGSGRTELLQAVAGVVAPSGGSVVIDGEDIAGRGVRVAIGKGIGLTPENRKEDGIFPLLGIDENMVVSDWKAVGRLGVLSPRAISSAAVSLMRRLSVKAASSHVEIATLSGGNQQKVVLARWLHARSRVLLLDEPTRGVDVEAKAQLYALVRELAATGCSVVFVSSELEELPAVCDRVLVLRGGRLVQEITAPDVATDALLAAAMSDD